MRSRQNVPQGGQPPVSLTLTSTLTLTLTLTLIPTSTLALL